MQSTETQAGAKSQPHVQGRREPVRVLAVTSGKGGVGKTNVSVNLGLAMAALGKRVMLLDADLGLANVDVLLGLDPVKNLGHVLRGECSLQEIILQGPGGLRIVPASSGLKRMTRLSAAEHAGLISAFGELIGDVDVLLIDTSAGISENVLVFSRASQEVIVVVCDEPTSMTDAYALIKVLSRDYKVERFHILANMVSDDRHGDRVFRKLARVTAQFLDVSVRYMGALPYDEYLRRAVQKQGAVVNVYPLSKSGLAFKRLAKTANGWPIPDSPSGHLEFFLERLIQASRPCEYGLA